MTPASLIQRAYRLAVGVGTDATVQPVLDNVWAFEEAFPIALRRAMVETPLSASEIESWRRDHTLTVAAGEVVLPDAVLEEFLDSSSVYLAAELDARSSYTARWDTYLRPAHGDSLAYYTHKEGSLHYRGAGGDPFDYEGDIQLVCVSMPDKPATISANMDLPIDLADRTVEILAELVRGRAS